MRPGHVRTVAAAAGLNHGWVFTGDTTERAVYTILSLGKEGRPSTLNGGPTSDFDCDIVSSNGDFFQWPAGSQTSKVRQVLRSAFPA
jgi:hypothetical protein